MFHAKERAVEDVAFPALLQERKGELAHGQRGFQLMHHVAHEEAARLGQGTVFTHGGVEGVGDEGDLVAAAAVGGGVAPLLAVDPDGPGESFSIARKVVE